MRRHFVIWRNMACYKVQSVGYYFCICTVIWRNVERIDVTRRPWSILITVNSRVVAIENGEFTGHRVSGDKNDTWTFLVLHLCALNSVNLKIFAMLTG